MSASKSSPAMASFSSSQHEPNLPLAAFSASAMDFPCRSGGLCELLCLGDGFLDGADHVERLLRQMIVVAVAQALEALDGVLQAHELARRAGEDLGDVERLREEALDLARTRNDHLVRLTVLVHAENRDDVLKRLVALQD